MLQELSPEFVPQMLAQLEDDLARSRKREAFWISIIVHIVFVLLIIFSPQLLPRWAQPHLLRPDELTRKEPTYLALPQDAQKPPAKVQSDKLSDKDRIAQRRRPLPNRKMLEALRTPGNRLPPGLPGPPALPQAAAPPQPALEPPPPPRQSAAIVPQAIKPLPPARPEPQLHSDLRTPAPRPSEGEAGQENPFKVPGSAGASIAAATRNTRPRFPGSGGGGGAGLGTGPVDRNANFGPVDILSDTQGVDFGPYLSRVLQTVKFNWYNLVPEEARPPLLKHGKVSIRFLISPTGKVQGLFIETPSGDIPLDRAAYGGITASDPFSPLPHEFHGPYLALRITFIYNPTLKELEELP